MTTHTLTKIHIETRKRLNNNLVMDMRPMNRKMKIECEWERKGETVNLKSSSIQPISTISFPITNYLFQQTNINYDWICAISICSVWYCCCCYSKFDGSLVVPMLLFLCDKKKFPLIFGYFWAIFFAYTKYFVGTIKSKQSK